MYTCITCGARTDELYRRYSSSVLKVMKCIKCDNLVDKYVEYDPVIVFVDLVLLERPAYRHLLYNSNFKSYWKLMIILIFGESYHKWIKYTGDRHFYFLLGHTTLSLAAFVLAVFAITEFRQLLLDVKSHRYKPRDLLRALIIGGFAKLLELFSIVWHNIIPGPHQILIYCYTVLYLLTAYSVVCETGRVASLIGLAGGFLAYNYVYDIIPQLYLSTVNLTLLQS